MVDDSGDGGVKWWVNTSQRTGYIRNKDFNGKIIHVFEPDFGGGFEYSFLLDYPISRAMSISYQKILKE